MQEGYTDFTYTEEELKTKCNQSSAFKCLYGIDQLLAPFGLEIVVSENAPPDVEGIRIHDGGHSHVFIIEGRK